MKNKLEEIDKTYAIMALRILIGPRDLEWHNVACELLDSGPDYARPNNNEGQKNPLDVFQMAGLILRYYCNGIAAIKNIPSI